MDYVLGKGIEVEPFESELIAYHPNGCVYVANETASVILRKVKEGETLDDAVREICAQFDISESQARSDALLCLNALARKGVVGVKCE